MIPLFKPHLMKDEWLEELADVFDTPWIGQGDKVAQFEREFGDKFGYKYCLGVNSGTSALELTYHLIGIEKDDEVITTVFTCTATNIPLLRKGAKIVFADINDKLLIDYEDVKRKITPKTKAIVVVTLGGLPIDERLFEFDIPVVVDAAQSLGVREKYGDYICYSFQAIKHFSTGDGGMLVVRDKDTYDRAKKLRWFGIDREFKKRNKFNCYIDHQVAMEIEEPGYKFHMNNIMAAMGLVGLRHSDEILRYRRALCELYAENLPKDFTPIYGGTYWLFAALTDRRDKTIEHLRANNVSCDLVQLRNDIFEVFGGQKQNLPNMNRLEDRYLYLPLHTYITPEQVKHITNLLGGMS